MSSLTILTMIQLVLTQGEIIRISYNLTNFAEISIDDKGSITVHNICGNDAEIIDKRQLKQQVEEEVIAYNYFEDSTNNEIPEIGDILVCHTIDDNITVGKQYDIHSVISLTEDDDLNIEYLDNNNIPDWASTDKDSNYYWKKFFNLIKKHA